MENETKVAEINTMSPLFKSPAAPASESCWGKHKVKILVGAAVVITGVALAILLWPAAFGISAAVITYGFLATLPTTAFKVALLVGGILCMGGFTGAVAAICSVKTPAIQLTADEPGAPFVKQDDYLIDLSDLPERLKPARPGSHCTGELFFQMAINSFHKNDLRVSKSKPATIKLQQELDRAQDHLNRQNRRFWLSPKPFTKKRLEAIESSVQNQTYRTNYDDETKKGFTIQKETSLIENRTIGIAHAQGRRATQEDLHIIKLCRSIVNNNELKYDLFGVIDGHGGMDTAKFIEENIQGEIERAITSISSKHPEMCEDEIIRIALKQACARVDIRNYLQNKTGGAVAVFTLKIGTKLYTANIGDTRAILKVGDQVIQLSVDGKPEDPRFAKSIINRGGWVEKAEKGVTRVLGSGPAPGRAFGDKDEYLKGDHTRKFLMSAHPKVSMIDLQKYPNQKVTLIQACDGIWDVLSSKDVGAYINHELQPVENAEGIVGVALTCGSTDNCSVLVTSLQ